MVKSFFTKEFLSFLIIGSFAALVNLGSRFFYSQYTSFGNAVILAFITGMITGFIMYKFFVFKKSVHKVHKEIFYFLLVNLATITQTYIISVGLAEYFFPYMEFTYYPEPIAHLLGVAFPALSSFLGHKYFSFKTT